MPWSVYPSCWDLGSRLASCVAIGITTPKRTNVLPGVPTIAESGVPNFDVSSWNGVLVPTGTPPEVIARLNAAFNKTLADPQVRAQLAEAGYEVVGGTPRSFPDLSKANWRNGGRWSRK
ncbi:tripartite tricarboxylate transporter substrate-binding protein [Cupriavidus basilensis]